jgi:hypothetical protein
LSEDDFLSITLAQLDALCEQWKATQRRLDERNALVCLLLYKGLHFKDSNKAKLEDFMPNIKGENKPQLKPEDVWKKFKRESMG